MSFRDKNILSSYDTKRINEDPRKDPVLFYRDVFSESVKADFHLGYFSTNAIVNIASSFASFIKKGGVVRFITNQYLSANDIGLLGEFDIEMNNLEKVKETYNDSDKLATTFKRVSQHFFNCLKYLIEKRQLQIIPVICKNNKSTEMSHYKIAFFYDDDGNWIYSSGSSNFSFGGLVRNGEKIDVKRSWKEFRKTEDKADNKTKAESEKDILLDQLRIENIINNREEEFTKIAKDQLIEVVRERGNSKDLNQLIFDEKEIQSEIMRLCKTGRKNLFLGYKEVEEIDKEPKFPFEEPRQYQKDANAAWVKNGYTGLFAMATGTGKTITSLNCLLNEYNKTGNYSAIILVPTISLASQWEEELSSFNFKNVINQSKNNYWKEELRHAKNAFNSIKRNFIFISTYVTFFKDETFYLINDDRISKNLILIADECHALGTNTALKKLGDIKIKKRIGLSATPNRKYDNIGTDAICKFFNTTQPKYTYFYSMGEAIKNGVLCEFDYFPRFVYLNKEELDEYYAYTVKLRRYIDAISGVYKMCKQSEMLLIQRKNIVHKAQAKIPLMSEIVNEIGVSNFKNAFIYVPEGFYPDYNSQISEEEYASDGNRIIIKYSQLLGNTFNLSIKNFNGDTPKKSRSKILKDFENGFYNALISMKCLDEGIDVPNAKLAVFCSSTGNSRQFVQRRGRVLRTYKSQKAKIFDMIVMPDFDSISNESDYNSEVNIFKSELIRIINFLALAENKNIIINSGLEDVCKRVGIDNIYELINNELKKH